MNSIYNSTQKAVVVTASKRAELVTDRRIPALRDGYILVKVVSVALNPTDWKHIDFFSPPGVLIGCDYSGIVEKVGPGVKKSFKKGDRICGFVHGGNAIQPEDGAFAEYIVIKGHLQIPIPENLSFQEAATLGVGTTTVGQGLYQNLGLSLPSESITQPTPILIYGGSTATGTLAIQFAKLSGYKVVTTCSPRNFDLVRRLGADDVFNYKDPKAAKETRKSTSDNLRLAFDTVSLASSAQFCDQAISTKGGQYVSLLPVGTFRENVDSKDILIYTATGEAFDLGTQPYPAKPEDEAFAEKWWQIAEEFLAKGQIKVHPFLVCKDGLKGVLEGFDLMRKDQVSGQKLVYNVSDTP